MKYLYTIIVTALLISSAHAQNNVGVGTTTPLEKLDVAGGLRIGNTMGLNAGTLKFANGNFYGNIDGTINGWKMFNGPWTRNPLGNYFLSPANGYQQVAIGDSLFQSGSKFFVRKDIVIGGLAIKGSIVRNDTVISEGLLGYQYSSLFPFSTSNFGVLGNVYSDNTSSAESFGVAGNNMESDTLNYGGYFIAQGGGGHRNIGVFGSANNGLDNWAGFFAGRMHVSDQLLVGTDEGHPDAKMQVNLPYSGDFAHLRIQSPAANQGFGISLRDSINEFLIGQNIGNWDDGRFGIASGSSFNYLVMLQNGDIALTKPGFDTPFARFQLPQKGSLNNEGLDLNNAAIYIGETQSSGMAFDEDQIESVGSALNLNFNSGFDVKLADGGGNVTVDAETAKAKFHVGENHTVLFGNDTIGKANFYPDAKFMFKPGKGGAVRIGQLNADGSLIGGTGYNYWDDYNVGWASIAIGNNTKAFGAGSMAIGIRASALNFGSVALGHLSRTNGNSAVAAGYYTRADAFVSCAVGAGNVGGGNANSWNALDPIFEVGNSIDTTNRSNAFTVLKNGRVGINHSNPQSMLDIEQPNSGPGNGVLLNLGGIGHWETTVDNAADYNFYFNNSLKAYILDSDGTYVKTSDRRLKQNIEPIANVLEKFLKLRPSTYRYLDAKSDSRSLGFIAQEVKPLFPELVIEKEGYLGIDYMGFSVLAVKAIQEMSDRFDQLNDIVSKQQMMLEELKKEIEALKK